jgi:dGTPase
LEFDKTSKYTKAMEVLKNISIKHIYSNKDVQTLELKGYTILTGLLDKYMPLLKLNRSEFTKLVADENIKCFISTRLIKRLSPKHIVAYKNSIEKLDKSDKEKCSLEEWYYRARLILDYISGMTDDFALNEYQTLTAMV